MKQSKIGLKRTEKNERSTHRPALNILYVSVTGQVARPYLDPSTRYRCFYPAEAARSLGHRAFVAPHTTLATMDPSLFDLVVIHRPVFEPIMIQFLRAARVAGTRLIADYDDLIFDPAFAAESSMFAKSWDTVAVQKTFERNTDALRLFEEFTVSTAPLRESVLKLHPTATVHVIANSVPPSLWTMISGRDYQSREQRPYLGYFPGTATHDEDFRVAASGVAAFCRNSNVPLRIIGPIQTDPNLFKGVQVEHHPLQPYDAMFDSLSACRVVLAPLVPSNFNRAKSHIKLMEAGLSCTACVASTIPDMSLHHDLVGHGTLVEGDGDWSQAIYETWTSYTLAGASRTREALVKKFNTVEICRPVFEGHA